MSSRKPTADELAGMAWWNNLSERQRSAAMQLAKARTVAEAWDWQKKAREEEGFDVKTAYARHNDVNHDEKSWAAGYLIGRSGKPADVPQGSDRASCIAGIIRGKSDRDSDGPLTPEPLRR